MWNYGPDLIFELKNAFLKNILLQSYERILFQQNWAKAFYLNNPSRIWVEQIMLKWRR